MDRAVADRMDRLGVPAAAALRDDMVPLDPAPEPPTAQEAKRRRRVPHRLSQWRPANQPSTIMPTSTQKATTPQKAQGRCA